MLVSIGLHTDAPHTKIRELRSERPWILFVHIVRRAHPDALRKQIEDLLAAISDIKPEQPKEVVEEVPTVTKRKKSK